MSDEDWGPWQIHDGMGLPVRVGTEVCARYRSGEMTEPFPAGTQLFRDGDLASLTNPDWRRSQWSWAIAGNRVKSTWHIMAFRIRRFRAEQTLREIAENIREPEAV